MDKMFYADIFFSARKLCLQLIICIGIISPFFFRNNRFMKIDKMS